MAESSLARAEESVAARFSRTMNAATSPWGMLTDLTVASAFAAIPLVLIVKQVGGGETRSLTTYVLAFIALAPIVAAVAVSISLRNARAEVVAWLSAQPFPIDNVNALLVGLTDTFEIRFADSARTPTRGDVQRRLEAISEDTLATEASPEERRVSVQIGVIESKRLPLQSTHRRWVRFQRIVTEVLVPLSHDARIVGVRLVLSGAARAAAAFMSTGPLLVLHVPAGGGHRAAAMAIAEAAQKRGLEVEVIDALSLAPALFARAYLGAHLFGSAKTPTLYGTTFELSNRVDPMRDTFRRALDHAVGKKLVELVQRKNPCAVICTHFYPLVELGQLRKRGGLDAPLVAVVTDYVTHAVWCAEGVDVVCTAPGRAAADAARHGTHGARIAETGIPVRAAFGRVAAYVPPRDGEALRVLVTSGGFGVGPVRAVLRSFRGLENVELDVVCGNKPDLVRRAARLAARKGLDAVVTGFADDMPRRMERAHVVVGKPGGLTMSECLAAGRPLVAVGTVPGQESANEDALVRWRAGMRASPARVGPRVVAAAGALAAMAAAAKLHGIPDAADRVLDAAGAG